MRAMRQPPYKVPNGWQVSDQPGGTTGGSPHKKAKVSRPEIPESEDGTEEWTRVEAANRPEISGLEKASWAIAHALEDLVVEVGELRKSVGRRECMQQEQVVQGAVMADMVELFGHGERFLRRGRWVHRKGRREMPIKKVRSRKSKGKEGA